MIRRAAGRWSGVAGAGWRSLLLGAQDFVHKSQQAIHGGLERVEPPVERGTRGGLGFVELGNVLQAVSDRHLRCDAAGGVVGKDLFVVVGDTASR